MKPSLAMAVKGLAFVLCAAFAFMLVNGQAVVIPNGSHLSLLSQAGNQFKNNEDPSAQKAFNRGNNYSDGLVYVDDPEKRAELGRGTWALLHTMAARYPDSPTETERMDHFNFIYLLGHVFPCPDCREHFKGMIEKYPPQVHCSVKYTCILCVVGESTSLFAVAL